ncbi:MAG: hypothetical protein OXE05_14535 [Chloroflexi bacterium]|nr:hypothetical protein [Chloroflexota bacterium]
MRIPLHRVHVRLVGFLFLALAAGLAGCETNTAGTGVDVSSDRDVNRRGRVVREYYGSCGPQLGPVQGKYHFEQVMQWTPDGGHLVFDHLGTISVVDREGTRLRMLVDADPRHPIWERELRFSFLHGFYFKLSPDGTRVVYTSCEFPVAGPNVDEERRTDHEYEFAVINLDGTGKERLTRNNGFEHYPAWSPDGTSIAYWAGEIYTMAVDGSDVQEGTALTTLYMGKESTYFVAIDADMSDVEQGGIATVTPTLKEKTYYVSIVQAPQLWSPDGERLAFLAAYEGGFLYTIRSDGTEWTRVAGPVVIAVSDLSVKSTKYYWKTPVLPAWSPDGELLAFVMADEKGEPVGVYTVRPDGADITQVLAAQDPEWRVSKVLWSPDGLELLIGSDSHFFIVGRDGSNARRVELANPLAKAWRVGAWSPDGERIAIYVPGDFDLQIPPHIYTVARDGTELRALVKRGEDGNLAPANPPQ